MKLEKSADGTELTVAFVGDVGDVDSMNADGIRESLLKEIEGVTDLTFDMKELEYISSAGLHLLLQMRNIMKDQGNMTIININE